MMQSIHDRMPVILEPADWDRWLDPAVDDPAEMQGLLRPAADTRLTMYPVSPRVNGTQYDDESLVVREDPLTLFE